MAERRRERRVEALFAPGDPVAVLGLGASGTAAARLAARLGGTVYASDALAGPAQKEAADALRREGIEAEVGNHDLEKILCAVVVVVSPGIDPASEVRRAVREAGVPSVAEVELAYRSLRSRVVGITGTNGKTTTTALCGHLLDGAGVDVLTAGNIGRPLSEVSLLEKQPAWVVAELSSFQLADLDLFSPEIGVFLNLAPDHLDRYGNLERYYADKERLFANATPDSRWLLNADDEAVLEMAHGVPGEHYFISIGRPRRPGAWLDDDGWLVLGIPPREEKWVRQEELRLLGRHNVLNALLAGTAAALVGATGEEIARGLRSFAGLPHRLQRVGEHRGVLWVNDSKATNIPATQVALRAFDRPILLCLGGRHKGEPYSTLLPAMGDVRAVVAYGEAAPQIVAELAEKVPVRVARSLEAVVRIAAELAEAGDAVLFSPACSSYDLYPNYEARGKAFEHAVRGLASRLNGERGGDAEAPSAGGA